MHGRMYAHAHDHMHGCAHTSRLGLTHPVIKQAPITLKTWPKGEAGDGVGVMLSGTFHPHAGQPPAPLQPLRVDVQVGVARSPFSQLYKHTVHL